MIRKTLILAAVAAALAMPSAGAFAAPKPSQSAPAAAAQQAPKFEDVKKAVVAGLTQMRDGMRNNPKLQGDLATLTTEVGKLPALEKAFVDATNAGDAAAAKKAADDYTAAATKIVEIGLPMNQAVNQLMQQIGMGMAQLGPLGERMVADKDVSALLEDITKVFEPLSAANAAVGALHHAASVAAQNRVRAEMERIGKEEFANAVNNYLNGQAAK